MENVDAPAKKVGRPMTRSAGRGRSSSLGHDPITINIPSPITSSVVLDIPEKKPSDDTQQKNDGIPSPPPNTASPTSEEQHSSTDATGMPGETQDINRNAPAQDNLILRDRVERIVEECQDFVELYEGLRLNKNQLDLMMDESKDLVANITGCDIQVGTNRDLEDARQELKRWKRIIKMFVVSMLGRYQDPAQAAAPPTIVPPPTQKVYRDKRDVSPDTLELIRRDVEFFMSKLSDNQMPDIGVGSEVSNSDLRDLHDIRLSQITKATDDCRKALKLYTSNASYDRDFARDAQERCEDASTWSSDLVARYHRQKLHLDKNVRQREITFAPFKPGGEVSIYQFLNRFEAWADGYLSEEAKADQLFNKYLDKTITDSYTEINLLRDDFEDMKLWLIKKYGSVVPIAHGCIKTIAKLKIPALSSLAESVVYLRGVHKLLVNLSELEITKGRPVPKLQSYLGSNAFLSALVEVLPSYIKDKLFRELLNEGIDDIDTVEGSHHLASIIRLIKQKFMWVELMIKSSPEKAQPSTQNNQQQSKKGNKPSATTHQTTTTTTTPNNNHQSTTTTNSNNHQPRSNNPPQATRAPNPPHLTGGNAAPIHNARQNQSGGDRWDCPINEHSGHSIINCPEFWEKYPSQRRNLCRYAGCYTCLDRNSTCRGGVCIRLNELPANVICQECAAAAENGKSPVCILMCGRNGHGKPQRAEYVRILESWIPNLNLAGLGTTLQVKFTELGVHNASTLKPYPFSKTGQPTMVPSNIVYDTTTGQSRSITQKDTINKTSAETAFYAMQTLRIKNQEVLVFYDSGSNGHLVDGQMAENLDLDILTEENVPVGGIGGKVTWSEYGMYSLTLGPDVNGECHELELQGMAKLTSELPEVNLKELWAEANTVLHGKKSLPVKVGGSRVQILIGIKSIQMAPKLIYSLPSGLGIYESVFYDVYQSNICFGGPHPIFTHAYREAGHIVNHMEVMFTEMARAYLAAPRTFVRVDVEEHGPPLELARELDLITEFNVAYPPTKERLQPNLSDVLDPAPREESKTSDVNSCSLDPENIVDIKKPEERTEVIHQATLVGYNNLLEHCSHTNCLKSMIPLAKLKGLQDEIDIPEILEYKCDACSNCPTCKLSARSKTISLQENFEQEVIKKSVHVDVEQARVWVDLPFIKEPVDYLTKKHSGPNNYNQAFKVYQAQCGKRDEVKEQVRKAHQELVEKGYMQELSDLPDEKQTTIKKAPFNHYYPWRAVYKEDSVTTPVRLVVDPTMTGLNEILAKGVNMLSKIPELLVRFRYHIHTWNTDISKLYNQLHLNQSALPYSLFLFHESLDKKVPPSIWVMSRAWYGVSSTGNQAGVALEHLADHYQEEYPAAHSVLTKSRYVDDVLSGGETVKEVEEQIEQTAKCLGKGGFSMKYIARSGLKPPPKASSDGRTVGCLGLSWDTEKDTLQLAFNEDFFLKRVKNKPPPPDVSMKDPTALQDALANNLVVRAGILSRVAELYDPCGWWEPIKVQMKLSLQHLNGLDWNAPVPPENRKEWVELFHTMNQLKAVRIPRPIRPEDTAPDLRIIVVADAAASSCGCAIYAGAEKLDGSFSCNLILAKSKMVHGTIPRNELEGVVLAAESALMVQRALSGHIEHIRYYTDSMIVMCWIFNKSKRLRMWAFNRVQAIRNMTRIVTDGEEEVPIFHISGLENLADLLTKPRTVKHTEMEQESVWQSGLEWMKLPSADLPSNQSTTMTEELADLYNAEVFQEVQSANTSALQESRALLALSVLVDPREDLLPSFLSHLSRSPNGTWFFFKFKFWELGWERARNRLRLVLKACAIFKHGRHLRINASWSLCYLCRSDEAYLWKEVDRKIDWAASRQTEAVITKEKLAAKYHLKEDIWFSKSRLEKEDPVESEDLDCSPFFDALHIKKLLPVVYVSLDLFRSYLAYIHNRELPHMGVEATFRRVRERFFPIGNARKAISIYKSQCPKCRLMLKKVVELELAQFPSARTTVAPPFWAIQLDIAMSFVAKPTIKSRKTFPCHALIIVCLLTSATNILVLDGLTTQAVVQAIERHSSRYGLPSKLFVDSGTQLEKLQDASFQLRDINSKLFSHRFQVTVAVPKAHKQQGRVEAKIKVMRQMLNTWSESCDECNTLIGWETLFSRIASAIDDLPIARGSATASNDLGWEIITPNRLKLGRNNYRQLEGPVKLDNCPQTQLERNRLLMTKWYEIFIQRLTLLIPPPENKSDQQPVVGDVVLFLFTDPNLKKLWIWKLGVVEEKLSRSSYKIRYSGSDGVRRYVQRAVGQISIIIPVEKLPPGDQEEKLSLI